MKGLSCSRCRSLGEGVSEVEQIDNLGYLPSARRNSFFAESTSRGV